MPRQAGRQAAGKGCRGWQRAREARRGSLQGADEGVVVRSEVEDERVASAAPDETGRRRRRNDAEGGMEEGWAEGSLADYVAG